MSIHHGPLQIRDINLPELLGFLNQLLPQTPEHVHLHPVLLGMLCHVSYIEEQLVQNKQKHKLDPQVKNYLVVQQ